MQATQARNKKLDATRGKKSRGGCEGFDNTENQHCTLTAVPPSLKQLTMIYCVHQPENEFYASQKGNYSFQFNSLLLCTPLQVVCTQNTWTVGFIFLSDRK